MGALWIIPVSRVASIVFVGVPSGSRKVPPLIVTVAVTSVGAPSTISMTNSSVPTLFRVRVRGKSAPGLLEKVAEFKELSPENRPGGKVSNSLRPRRRTPRVERPLKIVAGRVSN